MRSDCLQPCGVLDRRAGSTVPVPRLAGQREHHQVRDVVACLLHDGFHEPHEDTWSHKANRPIRQAILLLEPVPFILPPSRKLPGGMLEHLSGVNIWSNDLVPDILLTSVVGAVISILATIIPRIFFCMTPLANRVWVSRNSLACAQQIGDVWKESIECAP